MIGGYIYRERDGEIESRLSGLLDDRYTRIGVWNIGYLFHDDPFRGQGTSRLVTDDLAVLTQDPLMAADADGAYRPVDLTAGFAESLRGDVTAAFDSIAGDFRMAAIRRTGGEDTLLLVSHRAGSGRIYYHTIASGVVFASDLRFVLRAVGCDVNRLGIYSILKYGAVPEPMTIARNVSAVPPSHYLEHEVQRGRQSHLPYFKLRFPCDEEEDDAARDDDELLEPAKRCLTESARFLESDRPAILLSGGIDSSLYGCYLAGAGQGRTLQGFNCAFGDDDPELDFARQIADRIGGDLHIARMGQDDALGVLDDAVRRTDHPFSDFSSLPVTFLLKSVAEQSTGAPMIVECNGGDDCFGFPDLGTEKKFAIKHRVPRVVKRGISGVLRKRPYWKWESREGPLARVSALGDVHERTPLEYFLVLAPVHYLGLKTSPEWDVALWGVMDRVFSNCGEDYDRLSHGAKTTIRQLLHVNSRRWAAKALSVGESLGIRVVYPFVWREVLLAQGSIPWSAKIRDGVVKWPLKKLLEEHMPGSFIYRKKSGFVPPFARWLTNEEFNGRVRDVLLDRNAVVTEVAPPEVLDQLLTDARAGRRLRHSVLNFLWGALFTEMWLREHGRRSP